MASGPLPMTVLVPLADQRRARNDSHGIIGFSLGLVGALPASLHADERLIVVVNEELAPELDTSALRAHDEVRVVAPPTNVWARLWSDHVAVPRLARAVGADVVLLPKGFLPLGRRWAPGAWSVCLHDDIPLRSARRPGVPLARRAKWWYFATQLRRSVRRADQRLFVSAFTQQQLMGDQRPRADRVVHEGLTIPSVARVPLDQRQPQVVVLGSPHPHKRTMAGIELLQRARHLAPGIERIVVVGWLGERAPDPADLPIEHRVGPLSSDELAALIAGSRLLLFPSEYEGFGLPPLEALVLGTPVVHRRTTAVAEVLGQVPGGYDVEADEAFGVALQAALAMGPADVERLGDDLRRRYAWPLVGDRVASALREVARR